MFVDSSNVGDGPFIGNVFTAKSNLTGHSIVDEERSPYLVMCGLWFIMGLGLVWGLHSHGPSTTCIHLYVKETGKTCESHQRRSER